MYGYVEEGLTTVLEGQLQENPFSLALEGSLNGQPCVLTLSTGFRLPDHLHEGNHDILTSCPEEDVRALVAWIVLDAGAVSALQS